MSKVIASTYEIIEKIGSGGGGNVYLATHLRLGKRVVLKADKRKITTKPELLRREVDILKELHHSYIPQVYDFFIEDETVYTVMDYIQGESLDKPLKRGEKFSQPQVIKWARQILEALCYLHEPIHGEPPKGYVHSDIKPANIMRTPYNDISLIDFNIALALGEENVIGCSAGYASPEHYGLDYSSFSSNTVSIDDNETKTLIEETVTLTLSNSSSSSNKSQKKILPDVRSDIYSLGATLYHLLSGHRPSKDAKEVVPLSNTEFSPQLVKIISKAMEPNPDMRYQTAEEMLFDLTHLRENDKRTITLKQNNRTSTIIITTFFVIGLLTSFVGLQRMQTEEKWLKLSEYSQTALSNGDTIAAINYALEALPNRTSILSPNVLPEAQKALTDAVSIYDLNDGFKPYRQYELPNKPLALKLSPDGNTAACIYSGNIVLIDTNTAQDIITLPTDKSALSEIEYLDNNVIIYAGVQGVTSYDIETNQQLWCGNKGTAISISEDGSTVAAIYKDESKATIYNAKTGVIKKEISFGNKKQSVTVNDIFANPNDNLFEINENGSLLGVSFQDGSLMVYNLLSANNDIELFDSASGYTHFEGGFYKEYFAFSGTKENNSVFAVIDTKSKSQTGGFNSKNYFGVTTDNNGIYVQTENLLVKINPVTGEQTPLITTPNNISHYSISDKSALVSSSQTIQFFNENAKEITNIEETENIDFVQLSNGVAIIGTLNSPILKILKYKDFDSSNVFVYDTSNDHDELRISADYKTVMMFSYKQFKIFDINGELINKTNISNSEQVYDQQYIRKNNDSFLEVTYNNGTVITYDATTGKKIDEHNIEKPDLSLYEEFITENYKIESPLHGEPKIYDLKSGELIKELSEDGYLTYATQVNNQLILQFLSVDNQQYGVILNERCEKIANLPCLCDVYNDELYFDYPTGNMRKSRIYNINEIKNIAQKSLQEENGNE